LLLAHWALETLRDPDAPEAKRFEEARFLGEALTGRPADHDTMASVVLALGDVVPLPQTDVSLLNNQPRWRALQDAVANLYRAARLGPRWWRQRDGREVLGDPVGATRPVPVDGLLELDLLRERVRPRFRRLIDVLRAEPGLAGDREELARRLGVTRNYADRLVHDFKKLAREAM
jgi:hypothetical protein